MERLIPSEACCGLTRVFFHKYLWRLSCSRRTDEAFCVQGSNHFKHVRFNFCVCRKWQPWTADGERVIQSVPDAERQAEGVLVNPSELDFSFVSPRLDWIQGLPPPVCPPPLHLHHAPLLDRDTGRRLRRLPGADCLAGQMDAVRLPKHRCSLLTGEE